MDRKEYEMVKFSYLNEIKEYYSKIKKLEECYKNGEMDLCSFMIGKSTMQKKCTIPSISIRILEFILQENISYVSMENLV